MSQDTLFDKVWDLHKVANLPGGSDQILIGLHLIHEVTSPQAFGALKDKNFTAVNDLVSEHKESLKQFYKDNPAAKGKVALQDFNFNPETNTFATPREIFDAQFEGRYESLNPNLRKNIEKSENI